MSAKAGSPYELLGVKPGVSIQEIKAAYRDLAKVWHPDRFAHDERLQKKAEQKLQEINEAYDQLISGKTPSPQPTYADSTLTNARGRQMGMSLLLSLGTLLIFAVGFFVTRSVLWQRQSANRDFVEVRDVEINDPSDSIASESQRGTERRSSNNRTEAVVKTEVNETATQQTAMAPMPSMSTITVLVDPGSGLLAKSDCPVKTRMTYPSGSEPKEYCTILHPAKSGSDADGAEARVKAIAKRVATPNKWLGGSKEKTTESEK